MSTLRSDDDDDDDDDDDGDDDDDEDEDDDDDDDDDDVPKGSMYGIFTNICLKIHQMQDIQFYIYWVSSPRNGGCTWEAYRDVQGSATYPGLLERSRQGIPSRNSPWLFVWTKTSRFDFLEIREFLY